MITNIAGVLIAGGFSKRFGEPKAFAVKSDRYLFQFSIEALQSISDDIVIVTNNELEDNFKGKTETKVITDIDSYKGKGPLAGLYTAMNEIKAEWYAVAPVDTPFLEVKVFNQMIRNAEQQDQALIAIANERIQPLIGLYHNSLKPIIKTLLDNNQLAIQALLDQADTKYISFTDSDVFININKQSDYHRYIKGGRADGRT